MEFYFCKLYYQGANIYWVNDQITTSVSQIQCVSVFVGPRSKIYFTYIYDKPQPITPEMHFILQIPLFWFHCVSSTITQVDQLCCNFHLFTLVDCCVSGDHIIILFTMAFKYHEDDTWQVSDLLFVLSGSQNIIILNVGLLMVFCRLVVSVSCNVCDVIGIQLLTLQLLRRRTSQP